MTTINDIAQHGARSHKWAENSRCTGQVLEVSEQQSRGIDDNEPQTWADGRPRMQHVFVIQTDERVDDEDDGKRSIYAQGGKYTIAEGVGTNMLDAILNAYRKAGIIDIEGAILDLRKTGTAVPIKRGHTGAKLFTAKVEAGKTPVPPAADPFDDSEPF